MKLLREVSTPDNQYFPMKNSPHFATDSGAELHYWP